MNCKCNPYAANCQDAVSSLTLSAAVQYDILVRSSGRTDLPRSASVKKRCPWCLSDPLYVTYHDREWGVPVHDDRKWFEFLVLEGAQAGLNWSLILKKRENYRRAYDAFDFERVAAYGDEKIAALLADPGLIRNRLKIAASVGNARAFCKIRREFNSFDNYIWPFVGKRPIQNRWRTLAQLPARTELSDA